MERDTIQGFAEVHEPEDGDTKKYKYYVYTLVLKTKR